MRSVSDSSASVTSIRTSSWSRVSSSVRPVRGPVAGLWPEHPRPLPGPVALGLRGHRRPDGRWHHTPGPIRRPTGGGGRTGRTHRTEGRHHSGSPYRGRADRVRIGVIGDLLAAESVEPGSVHPLGGAHESKSPLGHISGLWRRPVGRDQLQGRTRVVRARQGGPMACWMSGPTRRCSGNDRRRGERRAGGLDDAALEKQEIARRLPNRRCPLPDRYSPGPSSPPIPI